MDPLKRAALFAVQGHQVAVIAVDERAARKLAEAVHSYAPEAKRFASAGNQRIEFEGGGAVRFGGRGGQAVWLRGLTLDYAVMDDHATLFDRSVMDVLMLCFATTDPHGRIAVIG